MAKTKKFGKSQREFEMEKGFFTHSQVKKMKKRQAKANREANYKQNVHQKAERVARNKYRVYTRYFNNPNYNPKKGSWPKSK